MILADFEYRRAAGLREALDLLAAGGTVLAGGQSLLPAVKAGRTGVRVLVDIERILTLGGIADEPDRLRIGALTRHCELAASPLVRRRAPLLARAASEVADPQIRHRGTLGGSLAHADPAADLPTALLALDAALILAGPDGSRRLSVAEFCRGRGQTALRPGELITEILVPHQTGPWGYLKFHRDALDWALVAVAATRPENGPRVRVALANLADAPLRATATEEAVANGQDPAAAAMLCVPDDMPLTPDKRASDDYRRHLARVLTGRALNALVP